MREKYGEYCVSVQAWKVVFRSSFIAGKINILLFRSVLFILSS
jgi:hypothetical protein